ncbi:MAG: hypothetical protein HDR86_00510 [Bacteroides sp.]|nr:hypothetical protein [Bacteroides sp.]MBD5351295.1 hypothetical protein [Bacteroides sp.]
MDQTEIFDAFDAVIKNMPARFDSHYFIREFIYLFPAIYGKLLMKHNNVATCHGEIANILRGKSKELRIQVLKEKKSCSNDIFGNLAECAIWSKF